MQPHVFVAMPFSVKEVQAGVRVDFDEVYALLYEPALRRAGCVPFRADKEQAAGDIRTDMYFELVTADVIIADISMLNANVFYELGIRHGVAPRGVFMVDGGWARLRIFDIAPDRKFSYDGQLFLTPKEGRDADWRRRMDEEVGRLAVVLRDAIAADEQTIGSPVYKELVGLKPADWTNVRTARANYFGEVFADWKSRVEVARENGLPGDILTLADDAPTRFHRTKLLWSAADALIQMERFEASLPVIEDVLRLDPGHRDALTKKGLVLARLGKVNEAKVHMLSVASRFEADTEAQGILGRVYKDLWRLEWWDLDELPDRQYQAVATSNYIAGAVRSYDLAARRQLDFYNGVNVVSFVKLLEHLKEATGDQPADCEVDDVSDMVAVVRFTAQNALDGDGLDLGQGGIWAAATLGELELVVGDPEKAARLYRDAANAPATTYFNVESMLDQVYLFERLGFRPEATEKVKRVLEMRRKVLEKRLGGLKKTEPRFKRVFVASGHMTDAPDRAAKGLGERFPQRKEGAVRAKMAERLDKWAVGAGDLAICGGARGGDLLFAELCAERGAEVWLFLALPDAEFIEKSVRHPEGDWEQRFFDLSARDNVKSFSMPERLKSPPKGTNVFARANLWMLNAARVEADDPSRLYAVLVWDEQPTGDGPGGTSDFAARVRQLGGRLAPVINPTAV
jgi:tetratricopeptide (TPR) repeat protein